MRSKWRIAASAFFGFSTSVLLIIWIRSYWATDYVRVSGPGMYFAPGYTVGRLGVAFDGPGRSTNSLTFNFHSNVLKDSDIQRIRRLPSFLGLVVVKEGILIPIWFLAIFSALLAVVIYEPRAWRMVPRQFSLRTLLLVTTAAALLLGLIAWATH